MPASTLDPVKTAIRNVIIKNSSDNYLNSQLASSASRVLYTKIEFEPAESYQTNVLNDLKSKYIVLQPSKTPNTSRKNDTSSSSTPSTNEDSLGTPTNVLYPMENVQLGWTNPDWGVGAGMMNMGNTCYLNSTLQALFHVPALVNWLLSDKQHQLQCENNSGGAQSCCIICAVSKTLQASQVKNGNAIRPWLVYSKLRVVCRHLIPGRQEDAHEFLRYLVEAMEKSYIHRFRNLGPLDSRSKETTPLNQILGGYLRSAVRCLECGHVSTTFQHFQDLLLDIRKVNTLDEALDLYFSKEKLDDNAYHCDNCKRKVYQATKQFTLERAPMVLCIQLKRFSISNNKITKQLTFKPKMDLTRFARQKPSTPLLYQLVAMVTHMGPTVSCGHYTAVARAASGSYYVFDDSTVRPVSQQTVLNTNAYIMLYEAIRPHNSSNSTISKSKVEQRSENESSNKLSTVVSTNGVTTKKPDTQQNGSSSNANGVKSTSESSDSDDDTVKTVNHENGKMFDSISIFSSKKNGELKKELETTPKKNNVLVNDNSKTKNGECSVKKDLDLTPKKYNTSLSNIENTKPKNGELTPNKNNCIKKDDTPKKNNSLLVHNFESKLKNTEFTLNFKKNTPEKNTSQLENQHKIKKPEDNSIKSSQNVSNETKSLKLVPYEVNDSSSNSSEDTPPTIVTKATTIGQWQVSQMHNKSLVPSLEGHAGWKGRSETVNDLIRMSHDGYTAPVATWAGNRAQLDREIANERREERKRNMMDNSDRGRVKHARANNGTSFQYNPGYNPFQEYSQRKWQNDNTSHRPFYNGQRYRYNNQRRGNHHPGNRHREKFRH